MAWLHTLLFPRTLLLGSVQLEYHNFHTTLLCLDKQHRAPPKLFQVVMVTTSPRYGLSDQNGKRISFSNIQRPTSFLLMT